MIQARRQRIAPPIMKRSMGDKGSSGEYSILHLGKFYPPHNGGMEAHLRDLAVRQVSRARVNVIVANSSRQHEQAVIEGVSVRRVARWTTIASMPVCPGLTHAIRSVPADLVHLHVPNPGAAFSFLLSGHPGKLVITHHADTLGRKVLRRLSDGFVRAAMERASAIIVTSERYLNSSEELAPYREKCRVIPLGIDLSAKVGEPATEKGPPVTSCLPLILAIGRLVSYKGFDLLIQAMERVDACLALIGVGPQAAELQALIDKLGLQQKVIMPGRIVNLRAYFDAASFLVMPSITRAEAFGMVQLEAMAAGLPVINTEIDSGVPEVSVHRQTGLTVPAGSVPALAEAMELLLSRPELREQYGRAARERVRMEFTIERMVERTLSVYKDVLPFAR